MAHRTLYVGDHDTPAWNAVDRLARKHGVSVSRIVARAIAHYLPHAEQEPELPAEDPWAHIAPDAA
jgi:hypothetical protein